MYSTFDLKCDSSFYSLQETKNKTESNNDHDIETSKYMLEYLLPYLRQLDLEQMAEMEIEARIQGVLFLQESLSLHSLFFLIRLRVLLSSVPWTPVKEAKRRNFNFKMTLFKLLMH